MKEFVHIYQGSFPGTQIHLKLIDIDPQSKLIPEVFNGLNHQRKYIPVVVFAYPTDPVSTL